MPFAWLDVHLSHFQHLGWRLLEEPDYDGNMIDYNDFADDQDPRAVYINRPEDHFRLWQEGGLLMVRKGTLLHIVEARLAEARRPTCGFPCRSPFSAANRPLAKLSSSFILSAITLCACLRALGVLLRSCAKTPRTKTCARPSCIR